MVRVFRLRVHGALSVRHHHRSVALVRVDESASHGFAPDLDRSVVFEVVEAQEGDARRTHFADVPGHDAQDGHLADHQRGRHRPHGDDAHGAVLQHAVSFRPHLRYEVEEVQGVVHRGPHTDEGVVQDERELQRAVVVGQGGQRGEQRRAVEGYRRELGVAQRGLLLLRFAEFRRVQRPRGVVGGQEASRHGLIAPVARVVGLAQAVLVQRHQPNEHAHAGDYPRNDERREVHPEDLRTRRVPRARGPGRPEGDELLHGVPPGAVREGPDPGPAAAVRGARRPSKIRHRGFVSKRRGRAASTARASLPRVAARAMGCAKVDDALIAADPPAHLSCVRNAQSARPVFQFLSYGKQSEI